MLRRDWAAEANLIAAFLNERLLDGERVVVGVSGGVDSDVVARLAVRALGGERVKLFLVRQSDFSPVYVENARHLARDLGVRLVEVDLSAFPRALIAALAEADPAEDFQPDAVIDPNRAKCSLRTFLLSTYQDRGHVVLGTSNLTEITLGFFLPFGDGIWHLGPIAHLYKSEVFALARAVGTAAAVIEQPPSAGFWEGQTDLHDLAHWLTIGQPVGKERDWSEGELAEVDRIHETLDFGRLDTALRLLPQADDPRVADESGLPVDVVGRLRAVVNRAAVIKNRPFGVRPSR